MTTPDQRSLAAWQTTGAVLVLGLFAIAIFTLVFFAVREKERCEHRQCPENMIPRYLDGHCLCTTPAK